MKTTTANAPITNGVILHLLCCISYNHIMPKKSKILVILGPTASGKSDLAVALAKKFNGEIISADSRQVYRGLSIGTGKITKREMQGVRHHLLDVASPKRVFTVVQYQKLARRALRDILRRGKVPIICGGTGLYIDALLYDIPFPNVPPNPKLRRKLEKESAENLFAKLQRLDPHRAKSIDPHNKRRLIRALEIVTLAGKPVPPLKTHSRSSQNIEVLKIGLRPDNQILKPRINQRLRQRLRRGMIEEAKRLHRQGLSYRRMEGLGLEYRYLARFLQGKISKAEMINQLEKEIWRYAKRQITWFKRDKEIHWLKNAAGAEALVRQFLAK